MISTADRAHAAFMLLAALGAAAYWITYFSSGATQVRTDEVYLAFENAFPLADGWMALGYLLSARFLLRGDRRAVFWGICAGSAMIFLGLMDLLFNLEQGHFRGPIGAELWAEIVIVAFSLAFGPFTLWRLWRHPLISGRSPR
jgi:hypothetical protein